MAKHTVFVYEVHQVAIEVEAETPREAKLKVQEYNYCQERDVKRRGYSHRLNADTWMVLPSEG